MLVLVHRRRVSKPPVAAVASVYSAAALPPAMDGKGIAFIRDAEKQLSAPPQGRHSAGECGRQCSAPFYASTSSRRGAILNRRSVLQLMCSGALVSPCYGQPRQLRRIGFLSQSSPGTGNVLLREFEDGLWASGYKEGRDLVLERRFSDGVPERSTAQARELVASQVDVLVASGNAATAAAMKATSTVPIVMLNTVEPVRSGFVLTLAKPGRNVTGVTQDTSESRNTKLLQLIRQLIPSAKTIAWLRSADLGAASSSEAWEATTKAAELLGLRLE